MRNSILTRLVLVLAVSALVAFVVARLVVEQEIRASLMEEFDTAVLARAHALGTLLEIDEGTMELEFSDEVMPAYSREQSPEYFEIWTHGGALLKRSPSLALEELERRTGPNTSPVFFDATAPDGRTIRCVGLRVPVDKEADEDEHGHGDDDDDGRASAVPAAGDVGEGAVMPSAEIVVGVGRGEIDGRIRAVRGVVDRSLLVLGLIVIGVAFLGVWLTRNALARVARNLEAQPSRALGPIDWSPAPPRELQPLTQALDRALAQAGAAVERERNVISGMAHELRTPVAELLTTTEVALDGGNGDAGLEPALRGVHEITLQMKSTVETMLTVARSQMPADGTRIQDVDVVATWADVAEAAAETAGRDPAMFHLEGPGSASVACEGAALRIVLATIAGNAAVHAPQEGDVRCRIRETPGAVEVEVSNPAPDLEEGDLPHLTEPLWRKEGGRGRGLGLGLHLASEVARYAGLELGFDLRERGLFVSVRIPRAGNRAPKQ